MLDQGEIAKVKRQPRYIQLMGDGAATTITRFVREPGEHAFPEYRLSPAEAVAANESEGYLDRQENGGRVAVARARCARRYPP